MNEAVYTKNSKLLTNDVDFKKRIKPSAVLNVFQEIAGDHAEELGVGFSAMAAQGMFWVLSRLRYEVAQTPVHGQEIVASTWPIEPCRAYFERDYEIRDTAGNLMIAASSVWCVLDAATHTMQPAKSLAIMDGIRYRSRRALAEKIGKLPAASENGRLFQRPLAVGDLDFNRHVNNTRYAEYIFDTFPMTYLEDRQVRALQIHYLREGSCGKTAVIKTAHTAAEDEFVVDGTLEGEPLFAASIGFTRV